MTPKQYHAEVRRTTDDGLDALVVGALGLSGEAGEAVQEILNLLTAALKLNVTTSFVTDRVKKNKFHDHVLDRDQLIKEMGDVLWYLTYLCNALGVTLPEIMDRNAAKLRARYPTGWDTRRSINRKVELEP